MFSCKPVQSVCPGAAKSGDTEEYWNAACQWREKISVAKVLEGKKKFFQIY